ncbi:hypothetical protein [Actinomadura sp. NPDC048394]|jgi:hypothetical protein|uniref:hypothetical protein n=1 Tax=Actinomadura sp. NPDC048394 TaxID=3158223 RepID=UPI00340B6F73
MTNTVDNEELVPLIAEALRTAPREPLQKVYGPGTDPDLLYEAIDQARDTTGIGTGYKVRSDPADPASTLFIEIELQGRIVLSFQVLGHGRPSVPMKFVRAYD